MPINRRTNVLKPDDARWAIAARREAVVRPLALHSELKASDVAAACEQLGVKKSLLYRLIKQYRRDPRASSLLPQKPGRTEGSSLLEPEVEAVIRDAIQQSYLSRQKISVAQLHRLIAVEARKAGLRPPSRIAVQYRLKKIDLATSLGAREGPEAARNKTKPVIGQLLATRPLEIVQVDHTRVDVFVVDETHRQPIQRPWLTLLIDVATRVVTGYYLTLEAPSSVSVAMALQHAVLPKEKWLGDLGITAPWPVHGLPEALHMDNAKEFHAKALRRGADEYGIRLLYRPVATPNYGGHIERLIGTMMGEVHMLPGTTFSNIRERGTYDSEHHAKMTLKELDHWLAIQIVGKYHHAIHRTLGRPPLAVWNERMADGTIVRRMPADAEHFYCDLLPYVERHIQRDGIHLFKIRYWDSVLTFWAGRSQEDFVIRYDPRDLSRIFVQSPEGEFWPVRYANSGMPPVSLWECKAARKKLTEQGRAEYNERMLFDAIEAQRLLVDEAAHKTKAARRQKQRRAEAMPAEAIPAPMLKQKQPRVVQHVKPDEEAFEPFEIEEWS